MKDQLEIVGMQAGKQEQQGQTISSDEESEGDFGSPADGPNNWQNELAQMAFPFYKI